MKKLNIATVQSFYVLDFTVFIDNDMISFPFNSLNYQIKLSRFTKWLIYHAYSPYCSELDSCNISVF